MIPEGTNVEVKGDVLIIKKGALEIKRIIESVLAVKIEGNKILLSAKRIRKNDYGKRNIKL